MSDPAPIRLAMWSGPRNLSTAMMRSFGNRADTAVWDEPFYAAYLAATGLEHPMRAEVLAAGETDADRVIAACLGPVPGGAPVFYQKQMCHHMLPAFRRDWIDGLTNVFLIRDPARVAASYAAKREPADLRDIGFVEQKELFDRVADRAGAAPPVIEAAAVRADPEGQLKKLCAAIGLPFDPAMLSWAPGPRAGDGVWAAHWYASVNRSTGFAPPESDAPTLEGAAARLADAARPYYDALAVHAL